MDNIPNAFEEKVERNLENMFGDKDGELRYITKLAMLDDGSEEFRLVQEKAVQTIREITGRKSKTI